MTVLRPQGHYKYCLSLQFFSPSPFQSSTYKQQPALHAADSILPSSPAEVRCSRKYAPDRTEEADEVR